MVSKPEDIVKPVLGCCIPHSVFRLLRATRMLRVLRTLKFVERLQRYTETIVKSMKDLGAILSLMLALMAAVVEAEPYSRYDLRFG